MNLSPKSRSLLFWFLITTIITVFFGVAWGYFEIWLPNRELMNCEFVSQYDPVEKQRLREACHKIISYPFGNHHDAFLVLEKNGNHESIPLLIRALSWQQIPESGDAVVCTTAHCVDSLRKLTGKDFGFSYEDWSKWWWEEGSKLSVEELERMSAASEKGEIQDNNAASSLD